MSNVSATDSRLLQLAPDDNIAVARQPIAAGELIAIDGASVRLTKPIPTGHKIAIRPIAAGEKVRKYGAPIGTATCAIPPGEYVHTHNVQSDYLPTHTLRTANETGTGSELDERRSEHVACREVPVPVSFEVLK